MAKISKLNAHRVVIIHPVVDSPADPSTADVLDQVQLVCSSLKILGIPYTILSIVDNIWKYQACLSDAIVFNLLEAPAGQPQLQEEATRQLELLGVTFTGATTATLKLTNNKLACRAQLQAHNLPVAKGGQVKLDLLDDLLAHVPPPWIIKPAWEDASIGLEGNPLCQTQQQVISKVESLKTRFKNQPILLEHFLPGREFSVSLLATENGVEVMPVAEMAFINFPANVLALLNYEAKWIPNSFAYTHTLRCFPTNASDSELLHRIRFISQKAWEVCGLSGYARVDIRLDETGNPHILEVNANPCISADAGFIAATAEAGLSTQSVIERILNAAVTPNKAK